MTTSETITITPNPECKACHGGGMLRGDSVPYGSTWTNLPDEYCDCVIEQLPDDGDYDIELKLADVVIEKMRAAAKAEDEFFARMEQEECKVAEDIPVILRAFAEEMEEEDDDDDN